MTELAEGARLEIVCTPKRGTEGSNPSLSAMFAIAGSCATKYYEPRQIRKEAAVVNHFVCRRETWLSLKNRSLETEIRSQNNFV